MGPAAQEVLAELPDAFVLGLTATPPDTLTADQKELVDELFGDSVFTVSIPAVVREGDLAPFAELAWLTTPTARENDWLAEQGERFLELTTALSDPTYGSILVLRPAPSRWLAEPQPTEEYDATLRMVHAGLLPSPTASRLAERHRHDPTADDWMLLLERLGGAPAYDGPGRRRARADPRRAAVGRLPAHQARHPSRPQPRRPGARAQRGEDRRARQIVDAEHDNLGNRLRMLVLCDHERATATLPTDLDGVISPQAGSARLALEHLLDSHPDLHPLLVTGRTVAGSTATLTALKEYVATYSRTWARRSRSSTAPSRAGGPAATGCRG